MTKKKRSGHIEDNRDEEDEDEDHDDVHEPQTRDSFAAEIGGTGISFAPVAPDVSGVLVFDFFSFVLLHCGVHHLNGCCRCHLRQSTIC